MAKNDNLHKAKDAKNDEFYTRIDDVAEELRHYKKHFAGKVVLCNCDDPTWSAFWRYFHLNFAELGLKKLISTHYDRTEPTYKMEYEGGDDNNVEVGVNTCTLKFEATAFRENDDNELESLSASISVPVENDDEVIGNMLGEEKLIVHAVAALYNLISDLRPNWLDNEDTSLTLDISIDGRKAQSCGGLVAMKEEGFTFGLED